MATTADLKERTRRALLRKRRDMIARMGPRVRIASCGEYHSNPTPTVTVRLHCGHVKRVDRLAVFPTASGYYFARCEECASDRAADIFDTGEDLDDEEIDSIP